MGRHHDERKRDLTLLKQGIIVGIFIVAVIFGPIIRGAIFKPPVSDHSNRITRLETQNDEHARITSQMGRQATIIEGLQSAQAQLIVQVEALATMVGAMQQREFARLEERRSGL